MIHRDTGRQLSWIEQRNINQCDLTKSYTAILMICLLSRRSQVRILPFPSNMHGQLSWQSNVKIKQYVLEKAYTATLLIMLRAPCVAGSSPAPCNNNERQPSGQRQRNLMLALIKATQQRSDCKSANICFRWFKSIPLDHLRHLQQPLHILSIREKSKVPCLT